MDISKNILLIEHHIKLTKLIRGHDPITTGVSELDHMRLLSVVYQEALDEHFRYEEITNSELNAAYSELFNDPQAA